MTNFTVLLVLLMMTVGCRQASTKEKIHNGRKICKYIAWNNNPHGYGKICYIEVFDIKKCYLRDHAGRSGVNVTNLNLSYCEKYVLPKYISL